MHFETEANLPLDSGHLRCPHPEVGCWSYTRRMRAHAAAADTLDRFFRTGALLLILAASIVTSAASGELVAVTRVVDGTSFEADGDRRAFTVHLLGIDPPTTEDEQKGAFAASSKAFLRCLIERKAVEIERVTPPAGDARETYAYVWLGEIPVNETVLKGGYGQVANQFKFAKEAAFRLLEEKARAEEKGCWAKDGPPSDPPCAATEDIAPEETPPDQAPTLEVVGDSPSTRAKMRFDRMVQRIDRKRWTLFLTNPDGMLGYDAQLTERESDDRYATWLRLDYVEAQPLNDVDYHYSLERVRFDCKKHVTQHLSIVKYNHQPDDTMKVVYSWTAAAGEEKWEPTIPESFGEQLYDELRKTVKLQFQPTDASQSR